MIVGGTGVARELVTCARIANGTSVVTATRRVSRALASKSSSGARE